MRGTWIQRLTLGAVAALTAVAAQAQSEHRFERFRDWSVRLETKGLAEPYRGIAIDGEMTPGLFPIRSTGVSTEPVRDAADAFLEVLSADERAKTQFAVTDDEWRKWANQHPYIRQGMSFDEMSTAVRESAIALLRASLSAKGLQLTRDIMRLNHTLGELNDNNFDEYGEWLYWITVMGEPSDSEPWGWQLDGHHAVINYFVLGDQVVMSPVFVGSEPVRAESGRFEGVEIMQEEQDLGLALIRSLDAQQRSKAVVQVSKTGNNSVGEAFRDNLELESIGIQATALSHDQKQTLLQLIGLYIGNMADDHAKVKMTDVATHLDATRFAWIGGTGDDAVFYYRIVSPVILIEFDHQRPVGLRHLYPRVPNRQHIHAVIRTPNGNDYGKDLLRQHYEQHAH